MTDVSSPAPGLIWHRPDPDSAPFCAPGDTVSVGQQVAMLEVMKMFAPITAETAGVFSGYSVENGTLVEAGRVVAMIEAS